MWTWLEYTPDKDRMEEVIYAIKTQDAAVQDVLREVEDWWIFWNTMVRQGIQDVTLGVLERIRKETVTFFKELMT